MLIVVEIIKNYNISRIKIEFLQIFKTITLPKLNPPVKSNTLRLVF